MTTASDPEQIRREIEQTQAGLSQDVDALTEKVTPSKIVERRVDSVRDTAVRLKDKVMGSALLQSDGTVSGQDVASSMQEATSTATGAVNDAASIAVETAQEAPQAVRRQTRSNPLAAGLIAFGAGWLVSSLLPASRREQELADQTKQIAQEKVQPVLQQVAGEVTDNLREPAQHAVESVKSTAQDAGQTVADEGRAAAQDAAGSVRSSANSNY
jgi:hypothetical protein